MSSTRTERIAIRVIAVLLFVIPIVWIAVGYWFLGDLATPLGTPQFIAWAATGIVPWVILWMMGVWVQNGKFGNLLKPKKYQNLAVVTVTVCLMIVPKKNNIQRFSESKR